MGKPSTKLVIKGNIIKHVRMYDGTIEKSTYKHGNLIKKTLSSESQKYSYEYRNNVKHGECMVNMNNHVIYSQYRNGKLNGLIIGFVNREETYVGKFVKGHQVGQHKERKYVDGKFTEWVITNYDK